MPGARLVAIDVVIDVAVALAFTRTLGSLLFGVQAVDALTFVGMSASIVAIGLRASYVPARRASKWTRSSRCAAIEPTAITPA